MSTKGSIIGFPVPRRDGTAKVSGHAQYVDDLRLPSMLHGATVRSPVPRGRITAIHLEKGIPWDEFTVVRAGDIPGRNCIPLILDDQPCLADQCVNHPEEPVLLLAHPDPYLLEEARRSVQIDIDPLPPVFSMQNSLDCEEIIWGSNNIFKQFVIEKGNVDEAWSKADFVVEGEYFTGAQEQLYIEPNGMMAVAAGGDQVTVWGSMQCPYYVHHAVKTVMGLGDDSVRIIQTVTGGGFGGKEEYPSIIAAHAALLTWKSGRPVKLVYDRSEDMAATTKRHPARIRHRTAVQRDGKLLGMEIEFTIDGGAYATLSPVVLSRGAIHAAGPYSCPNIRIRSTAVATNATPYGAFRGFGAPQTLFALERHMDKIAAVIGFSPAELRRKNFIRKGDTTSTGQQIQEDIDLSRILDRALAESDYHRKKLCFSAENRGRTIRKGIGISASFHGAGFTGSGERYLASIAGVEATAAGQVRILTSAIEMGQGTNTILPQIVAETLSLPLQQVEIAPADTASVPNSGPTVASRTCMIIGKLVERAALDLKRILEQSGFLPHFYTPADFRNACSAYIRRNGALKASSQYETPPGISWDDDQYKGDAYQTFAWAVHVAEVSVDVATWEVSIDNFVAVQDIGKVIHPVLAAGQVEGGIVQGIGYALYEDVVVHQGRMANSQMTNYIVPTAADVPAIRAIFIENPYAFGPMGAKGVGELPIDGPAPAILNAIENAVGIALNSIPATPEKLMYAAESCLCP
jgi:CO/xanthine dehydrogenase Mo-binding subunit